MNANDAMPINKFTFANRWIEWLKPLGIAALYALSGYITHRYFTSNDIVSISWPGSGLALAVLLMGGKRYLWGILLGALLVNTLANDTLVGTLGTTLASMLEVMLGVWLLTRNDKFSPSLNALSDYLRLIVLGGAVASSVGAIVGALALLLANFITPADYAATALLWWMGDTLGVVLVAPLILAWCQTKPERFSGEQAFEGFVLVGLTFIAGQIVFLGWFHESLSDAPRGFMMFLFVSWVAIRLGVRATTFVLNMVAIQALSGAYLQVGFFANEIARAGFNNYWFYILILSVVGMALTTYVTERHNNQQRIEQLLDEQGAILENRLVGIATARERKFVWCNPAFEAMMGCGKDELIGVPTQPFYVNEDDYHAVGAAYANIESEGILSTQLEFVRKDGQHLWLDITGAALRKDSGESLWVFVDATERKAAEVALRRSESKFRTLYDSTSEAVMLLDERGFFDCNRATLEVFGCTTPDEFCLKHPADLSPPEQPCGTNSMVLANQYIATALEKGSLRFEWMHKRADTGESFPADVLLSAMELDGKPVVQATVRNITERKQAEDEIQHLAFYDPLTGLPNRRLLYDRLRQALAFSVHSGRVGALLFIDLDNFKTLNDTLGHDIGDLLLQQVAQRLKCCLSESDTVARLGGDEFVVILEDMSEQTLEAAAQTETLCEKILATLGQTYQLGTYEYQGFSSIGATIFNAHQSEIDELLKQADIAMYQAKSSGRNTVRFFDPQMQANITARVALEAGLRLALAESQFRLYYQLQTTHNNQAVGAEVLIRWEHPERGLVSPADFIPLAEETGLILPIGHWVLETACAQLKQWEQNAHTQHLQLAVNVSARQFYQADFVKQVCQVINHAAIKPDRLKLELTESLVLDDIEDTIHKMKALREIGVRFSMDDFGTGHSSLSNLKKLPLDQLKIDQSFVRDISIDPDDAVIVQTIIVMAKNLGMDVIAEGVETETQRAFLEQHGCWVCQGYLFSKPVPLAEFEQLLEHLSGRNKPMAISL